MLDATDLKIIDCLRKNARAQWREIGMQVHLTGQAVADRVHRMEDLGIIEGYRVQVDESRLGTPVIAFITVFMKTAEEHQAFQNFIREKPTIKEAHRNSGEGCYLLKASTVSHEDLNRLLDEILIYGNYRVNLSLQVIKK